MANFFVWHPERAWAISAGFLILYIASRSVMKRGYCIRPWNILLPSIAWFLFGLGELSSKLEGSDIRIDLMITWPLVALVTVVFTLTWLISFPIVKKPS